MWVALPVQLKSPTTRDSPFKIQVINILIHTIPLLWQNLIHHLFTSVPGWSAFEFNTEKFDINFKFESGNLTGILLRIGIIQCEKERKPQIVSA